MVWNASVIALHDVSNARWSAQFTVGNSQMVMERVEEAFTDLEESVVLSVVVNFRWLLRMPSPITDHRVRHYRAS